MRAFTFSYTLTKMNTKDVFNLSTTIVEHRTDTIVEDTDSIAEAIKTLKVIHNIKWYNLVHVISNIKFITMTERFEFKEVF